MMTDVEDMYLDEVDALDPIAVSTGYVDKSKDLFFAYLTNFKASTFDSSNVFVRRVSMVTNELLNDHDKPKSLGVKFISTT